MFVRGRFSDIHQEAHELLSCPMSVYESSSLRTSHNINNHNKSSHRCMACNVIMWVWKFQESMLKYSWISRNKWISTKSYFTIIITESCSCYFVITRSPHISWIGCPLVCLGAEKWEFKLTLVGFSCLHLCRCKSRTFRQYVRWPSLALAAIRSIAYT